MNESQASTSSLPKASLQRHPFAVDASFESLAEAMPIPILATTREGVVVSLNSNARFLFDHHQPLAGTTSLEDVAGSVAGECFRRALEDTLEHGSSLIPELPPVNQFIQKLNFVLSTTLMSAANEPVVVFSLREVTSGLELTRLQAKDKLQDYMFRALVHDLRTPLSAISSGTQYLESEIPEIAGQSGRDVKEILGVLKYSCNQVEGLLEDLGELVEYHINPSGTSIEVLSLDALVQDVLDVYRVRGLAHVFEFTVDGSSFVHAVHQRLTRAIDNLISNAVKYSPKGGTIAVAIGPDPEDPNRVRTSISDSGIGMDSDLLQRIWEPFYRFQNEDTANIAGTGLGLSIVRFVIENHGGTIDVESERGKGTTFHISLPRGH